MEQPKQLLPYKDTSLLGQVISQAKALDAVDVFVVLGANKEKIKPDIENLEVAIIENRNWKNGLGSSIATGTKFLLKEGQNYNEVLISLADQPLLDTAYFKKLIEVSAKHPLKIIATKYPKSNGVPAVFPREYFKELSILKGEHGAKALLNAKNNDVITIDSKGKNIDIDTPEDYRKIIPHN